MPKRASRKTFVRSGISVLDRPFYALTESQRELRFDTVAWHEREIFLKELLKHPVKRIRDRAERSTQAEMQVMVRAWKQGVDLASVTVARLQKSEDWTKLPLATALSDPAVVSGMATPAIGGTFADLGKVLDEIVRNHAGPGRPVNTTAVPGVGVPRSRGAPQTKPSVAVQREAAEKQAAGGPQEAAGERRTEEASQAPRIKGLRHAASQAAAPASGAIPEPEDDPAGLAAADAAAAAATFHRKEIELIRSKLVVNGRVRLDVEALAVYLMCPSYFAIATGLDPEPWQSRFLDSYAVRLGCLASRQCGKSIITARKATGFALCNPATTTLILAPTLRQSSELLLKISGTAQIAGLKVSSLSQFQLVLADKQPGAASRIVCLPGSNEDSGASTRGYAADLLILEEAAFLSDVVISSVLPSIAARPKAQLIGISSAGIIGTYFHSVMTSPQSRWTKMIVPASRSGRFSLGQLEELKLTLGARYGVEMECAWGSVGDSIYTADVMDTAFGTDSTNASIEQEVDPDAAFAHLDMEAIFAARAFERKVA